jgi:hypothetical protein
MSEFNLQGISFLARIDLPQLCLQEEFMSTKVMGIIVTIIGLLIIAVGLSAGYIGLSSSRAIGPNKMIMAGVGLIVGIVGIVMVMRKGK